MLRDPSPANDTRVTDAWQLYELLNRSHYKSQRVPDSISYHIVRSLDLGALESIAWSEHTILPDIRPNQFVTLWSTNHASLDIDGAGRRRIFRVHGGQLRLQGLVLMNGRTVPGGGCIRIESFPEVVSDTRFYAYETEFVNCTTNAEMGGGVYARSGDVQLAKCTFANCRVERQGRRNAIGGGLAVQGARVNASNTIFRDCHTYATYGRSFGGGVGVFSTAEVHLYDLTFRGTSSNADGDRCTAFGGGLGIDGGTATIHRTTWVSSGVHAGRSGDSRGGGLGMTLGRVNLFDCNFRDCYAVAGSEHRSQMGGIGGSISVQGSRLYMWNVTLRESRATSMRGGVAIFGEDRSVEAVMLRIYQTCAASDWRSLIRADGAHGSALLMRELSITAASCNQSSLVHHDTRLMLCESQGGICGPNADCNAIDISSGSPLKAPVCTCPKPDERNQFWDYRPSEDASRPEFAPYEPRGCVRPNGLRPNWWRFSELDTVRPCVPSLTWSGNKNETPCRGGEDAADVCAPGLKGPLCRVCQGGQGYFFDGSTFSCAKCPIQGVAVPALSVAIFVCICLLAGAIALVMRSWRRRSRQLQALVTTASSRAFLREHASQTVNEVADAALAHAWLRRTVSQLGLVGKLKVIIAYFQIVLVIPLAFSVPFPDFYRLAMSYFEVLNFDLLGLVVPSVCYGDYAQQLRLMALGPLAGVAAMVCSAALISMLAAIAATTDRACLAQSNGVALKAAMVGAMQTLPTVLFILFALLPITVRAIFSTFSCESFVDGDGDLVSFLYADMSVKCSGSDYDALVALASALIVLWPIGVPLLLFGLLLTSRMNAPWAVGLSRAIEFLHVEYRNDCFYWEVQSSLPNTPLGDEIELTIASSLVSRLAAGRGPPQDYADWVRVLDSARRGHHATVLGLANQPCSSRVATSGSPVQANIDSCGGRRHQPNVVMHIYDVDDGAAVRDVFRH